MSKYRYQALGPLLSGEGSRAFLGLALQDGAPAQPVVMIWVPPETAQDIEQVTQIHKETQRAITLEHPHIIRVHALAALEEGLARVVEFADGESLRRVLEVCHQLPLPFAALVVADAATGLHYAHLAGNDDGSPLVHGDVRPETLMVCFSGATKVGGYGALTVAPRESGGKRVLHRRLYSAPEQIIGGRGAINVPTDVYLLGITLFECLTGQMPFQGEANFDQAIVNKPLTLAGHPEIPPSLIPVLQKATSKRANERYASALALREALVQAVGPLPTHEEFAAFLEQHFPMDDAARAARRRVLDAGLADDTRRLWELKGHAGPPPAAPPLVAAVPRPSAVHKAVTPRASSASLPALGLPKPEADEPRRGARPYVPVAIAAALGAAAAFAYLHRPVPVPTRTPVAAPVAATLPPVTEVPPAAVPPSAPTEAKPPPEEDLAAGDATPSPKPSALKPVVFHQAEPGELQLAVVPPVEVSVDGHHVGRSPVTLPLKAGRHTLQFRDKQLGVNTSRTYVMSGHGKQTTQIALGKGFLSVAIPSGSVIFLDGRELSKSSVTDVPIYEGGHQLVVTLGEAKWRQGFDVRPDEHMTYNVQAEQQTTAMP